MLVKKLGVFISLAFGIYGHVLDDSDRNGINDGVRVPTVIGGMEVRPAFKYPWIVSLQWKGSHVCGGTLIKPNLVLTAAHCSTGNQNEFTVAIHRHNLSKSMGEEKSQSFKVVKRYVHENYNTMTNFNDAALWKLSGDYQGNFQAIEMDDGKASIAGGSVLGIGWGRLKVDGPLSQVLMEVEMPVTNEKTCIDVMREQGYTINPELQVCAGLPEGGKDTCQGDSGGPLIAIKNDKMVFVGITSFGISCALPNLPGIYTKIHGIQGWIDGKIAQAYSEQDSEKEENNSGEDKMNQKPGNSTALTSSSHTTPLISHSTNNSTKDYAQAIRAKVAEMKAKARAVRPVAIKDLESAH